MADSYAELEFQGLTKKQSNGIADTFASFSSADVTSRTIIQEPGGKVIIRVGGPNAKRYVDQLASKIRIRPAKNEELSLDRTKLQTREDVRS